MKKALFVLSLLAGLLCIFCACKQDKAVRTDLSAVEINKIASTEKIIPDNAVINSAEALTRFSSDYPSLSECFGQNLTENFFENCSYLLVNFYHSSSERNIAFKSAYLESGILKLKFNIESPESVDTDYNAMLFILSIDKIVGVQKFEIEVDNLLLNNNGGGFNSAPRELTVI